MSVDPVAAVSLSGGGASAVGAETTASAGTAASENTAPTQQVGESDKVDIFDFKNQTEGSRPALDTLQAGEKANYLSNPSILGERVLNVFESFQQRSVNYESAKAELKPDSVTATAEGGGSLPGPAAELPPASDSASSQAWNSVEFLELAFNHAIEANFLNTGTSQFSKTINTLMRGQ
ncbi:MAG: hypothetical protein ACR2Q4_23170 [Geminicoccaceae bacterium]